MAFYQTILFSKVGHISHDNWSGYKYWKVIKVANWVSTYAIGFTSFVFMDTIKCQYLLKIKLILWASSIFNNHTKPFKKQTNRISSLKKPLNQLPSKDVLVLVIYSKQTDTEHFLNYSKLITKRTIKSNVHIQIVNDTNLLITNKFMLGFSTYTIMCTSCCTIFLAREISQIKLVVSDKKYIIM